MASNLFSLMQSIQFDIIIFTLLMQENYSKLKVVFILELTLFRKRMWVGQKISGHSRQTGNFKHSGDGNCKFLEIHSKYLHAVQ